MIKIIILKHHLFLYPLLIILLCQCKKESVDKEGCVDVKLLTDVSWYPDKTYDVEFSKIYRDGGIDCYLLRCGGGGDRTIWKIDCNQIFFKSVRTHSQSRKCPDGFCDEGKKIVSLTKSMFQYQDDSLITLYNPRGDKNGSITIKSDLGDFNFNQISGAHGGANRKDSGII